MTVSLNRVTGLLSFLTCTLIVALCAVAIAGAWVNHDAGWYLHMTGRWLDGAVLYRDVIDTNPPLIVFLTALPVLLARTLHLPVAATFKSVVFVVATLVAASSMALLRRIHVSATSRWLVVTALLYLVLPFAGADFGQREHLTMLLVAPYLLGSAAFVAGRPLDRRIDLLIGLVAGLGFAMKPHFLIAWIGAELYILLAYRRRGLPRPRAAAVGVGVSLVLYSLVVILFVRQYFEVAVDVAELYGALNADAIVLWRLPELRVWIIAGPMLLFIRLPAEQRRGCLTVFIVATGFLLAAVIQMKGWGYHLYPFRACIGLYFAMTAAAIIDRPFAAGGIAGAGRLALVILAGGALAFSSARSIRGTTAPAGIEHARALHTILEREGAESFAVLSMRTILFPAFPVANYTRADWVLRHHSLWFLPGFYAGDLQRRTGEVHHRAIDQMSALERQYFAQVIEDLCARPPRTLIIEPPLPPDRPGPRSVDLLAYYAQDERFARLFPAFQPVETFGPFTAYVRRGPASCDSR